MTQVAPFSGTGIDRRTGKVISGWDHVLQSLEVIFTTRFGERVMRRWFGSFVPNLLGERMVPSRVLKFWTAICIAIDTWEPRYKITKIVPLGTPEGMRLGALGFEVHGLYFPKGHLGDYTVSRAKTFVAGVDNGLRIQRTAIPPLRAPVDRTPNDLSTVVVGGLAGSGATDAAAFVGSVDVVGALSGDEAIDNAAVAADVDNYDPETALGTDLIAYWDANRGDLISVVSNGVSSWRDVVAGYDLTQSTAGLRPVYAPDSFEGAPGISFNGTSQFLISTDAALLAALPSGAVPCEIWVLLTQDALAADTGTRYVAGYSGSSVTNGRAVARVVVSGTNRARGYTGIGASATTATDTAVNFSGTHVVRHVVGATQSSISVDGEAAVTASVVPVTEVDRFRVGAISAAGVSNYWQGQVAAVLVTKPLSSDQAAALHNYLG